MFSKLTIRSAALAVLALFEVQAAAAEPVSHSHPVWLRKPSANDMARYYPERGRSARTPGRVILDCDMTAAGQLDKCRVVDEWPTDYGFGNAALKLSRIFQLDPKTVDMSAPNPNQVVVPIHFTTPERRPPDGYLAGQNAVSLTVGVEPGTKGAKSCPTADKPAQLCVVHALEWKEQPWLDETLPLLDGVDMDSGITSLQCGVDTQSRLAGCMAAGNPTPIARKAMLAVAAMLVAPEKAVDGASVGEGPVIIPFDWSQITPLARALKRP